MMLRGAAGLLTVGLGAACIASVYAQAGRGVVGYPPPPPSPAGSPTPLLALLPDFFPGRNINVCTSHYPPIVSCLGQPPGQYSGYEIEVFDRVRQLLGWAPDRITWKCLDWYAMVDSLGRGNQDCDLAVAGMEIREEHLAQGLVFTYPTLLGGYRILVKADEMAPSHWAFLDAFTWQLWVALLLTALAMGAIVWLHERWWWQHRCSTHAAGVEGVPGKDAAAEERRVGQLLALPPSLRANLWGSVYQPFGAGLDAVTFGGKLIIFFYTGMLVILMATFTANTAALITTDSLSTSINDVSDLPGRLVVTWEDPEYVSDMQRRNIRVRGMPWNSTEDLHRMMDVVRRGEVDAMVLDGYVLEYIASGSCDLAVVGGLWGQYIQGPVFPAGFNNSALLKAYDRALISLQQSGTLEALIDRLLTPSAACSTGVNQNTDSITFKQVAGLWFLMAISVAVAVLIAVCHWLCNTRGARTALSRLAAAIRPAAARQGKPAGKGVGGPRRRAFGCAWCAAPTPRAQHAQQGEGGKPSQPGAAPSWLHGSSSSAAKLDLESSLEEGAVPGGRGIAAGGDGRAGGPGLLCGTAPQDSANLARPLPLPAGQQPPPTPRAEVEAASGLQQGAEGPDLSELLAAVQHMEQLLLAKRTKGA